VLLDQRGSGRSLPLASELSSNLASNTTPHLIADIERLRELLGIESWVILGLSWGTTLGLAYAHAHPRRVKAMVLGFVTTTSHAEVQWITGDVGRIFPREWERFSETVPQQLRGIPLVDAYAILPMPMRPFAIEPRRHGANGRMRTFRSHRDISQIPDLTTRSFDYDLPGWSLTIGATPHFSRRVN
jgi:pimeloyl-ACP methyl ester carboxylesterase